MFKQTKLGRFLKYCLFADFIDEKEIQEKLSTITQKDIQKAEISDDLKQKLVQLRFSNEVNSPEDLLQDFIKIYDSHETELISLL